MRVPLRPATSLVDLEAVLAEAEAEERRRVGVLLRGVLAAKLSATTDDEGEQVVQGLGGDGEPFVGQCVWADGRIAYCSLVASEKWAQREEWLLAEHAIPA
jgi:hypothetical protein